jgi:hypothetical protein
VPPNGVKEAGDAEADLDHVYVTRTPFLLQAGSLFPLLSIHFSTVGGRSRQHSMSSDKSSFGTASTNKKSFLEFPTPIEVQPSPLAEEPKDRKFWMCILSVLFATFLGALDLTSIPTMLPTCGSFHGLLVVQRLIQCVFCSCRKPTCVRLCSL